MGFFSRIQLDVVNLFEYLSELAQSLTASLQSLLGSAYPIVDSFSSKDTLTPLELVTDSFGFRRLLIVSTGAAGRLFALDTSNSGKVLWSSYYPNMHIDAFYELLPGTSHPFPRPIVLMHSIDANPVRYFVSLIDHFHSGHQLSTLEL